MNIRLNNKIIVNKNKIIKSFLGKFIGLMFSKQNKNRAITFVFNKKTKVSLHMFFVFYPIDVIWLNSKKEIIFMKENFIPFTLIFPKCKANYVIELPVNTIKNNKIKKGNILTF